MRELIIPEELMKYLPSGWYLTMDGSLLGWTNPSPHSPHPKEEKPPNRIETL